MPDGIGETIYDLGSKAFDYFSERQAAQNEQEIARINAQAETSQVTEVARSKNWLYLGIGILGAAYLLFNLRKME